MLHIASSVRINDLGNFLTVCFIFQRACYLSLNPQKDETLETEKAQYTLPDGSTLDVSDSTITSV